MTALTSSQIAAVRADTGDHESPYEITDTELQSIFDDTAQAAGNLELLRVYVLRRRLGKAVNDIASQGENQITAQRQQKFDQIMRLLAYWEKRTGATSGQGGTAITAGRINLNFAASSDDLGAES